LLKSWPGNAIIYAISGIFYLCLLSGRVAGEQPACGYAEEPTSFILPGKQKIICMIRLWDE
jgi:hypothetical protein